MNFNIYDFNPIRRRWRLGMITIATLVMSGCSPSPPAPPVTSDVELSVGMPTGQTDDPGVLRGVAIAPPRVTSLDPQAIHVVEVQLDAATRLVQQSGSESGPIEVVPSPQPDPVKGPNPQRRSPTDTTEVEAGAKPAAHSPIEPEIVATPDRVPESELAKAAENGPSTTKPAHEGGASGPETYQSWAKPAVALVLTGQQHGYIEPCGCTGLDRQKGGVARRYSFIDGLRADGWTLVPLDVGNQVRRFGRQSAIKLQQTARALDEMDYQAVGFGPDDVRLGVGDLLAVAAAESPDDDTMYVSANVVLIDPELVPQSKVIETGGMKIGVTSVLDPRALEAPSGDELLVQPPVEAAQKAVGELSASASEFNVLLYFGKEEWGEALVRQVPGFDLIVVAGGYGEPTYQARTIEGSKTRIVLTGDKGMYAGLVGLYADGSMKYARVPLTHEFADAPAMRRLMQDYQNQLRDIGLGGLGLLPPIPHSSGQKFVGSKKCGQCHTAAYDIWESSAHAQATADIVAPPAERGDIARHFDPECISCHVTGWNPQEYYPYASGYLSLDGTSHLTGNGCENCHGPGSGHVEAEQDGSTVAVSLRDQLRDSMKLPLSKAREKCIECHDLDNSIDFHEKDAFEDLYWPEVEHYGKD